MPSDPPAGIWPDDVLIPSDHDGWMFRMPDGRRYLVSRHVVRGSPNVLQDHVARWARYIDEHPEEDPVYLMAETRDKVLSRPDVAYSERARRLLRAIIKKLDNRPGQLSLGRSSDEHMDLRRASYLPGKDYRNVLIYLRDTGLIEYTETTTSSHITVPVHTLINLEQSEREAETNSAFVAMWFDPQMTALYDDAIVPAVEQCGFRPFRVDQREHNNKIDDEIIASIRRCRFLIADFTCGGGDARGGVYYEAGFAAGLGKPVIYMVRADDLSRVHFDTRQINHIIWDTGDDLRVKLANRIAATIQESPLG